MTPIYKIERGGIDITGRFNDRCTAINVTLTAGAGSGDVLKITLDDRDWAIAKPNVGEIIDVYLGYVEAGLAKMGTFEISRVVFEWVPKSISLEGSSIGFQSAVKAPAIKTYADRTLGDVVRDIAKSAGVAANISPELEGVKVPERNVTTSPLQLLTELEFEHGAVAKWGDGRLGFTVRDSGKSPAGESTPLVVLRPEHIAELSIHTETRPSFSKARMSWFDQDEVVRKWVEAPAPRGANGSFPAFNIGRMANSKEEAERIAKSQISYLTRNQSEGQITLSRGNPFVRDQSRILITETRDGIAGSYVADVVSHSYVKGSGLGTAMSIRSDGDASDFTPELEGSETELTGPGTLPGMPR